VVYRRTDGHPLFMVQVTDIWRRPGSCSYLTTPTALVALAACLPPALRELIEAQLGRLSAEEQQVMEVGSVAGRCLPWPVWPRGCSVRTDTIEAACERLARRGPFLEEQGPGDLADGTVSGALWVSPCPVSGRTLQPGWGVAGRRSCIGRWGNSRPRLMGRGHARWRQS